MKLELHPDGVHVITSHGDESIQWNAQALLRKSSEKIGTYGSDEREMFKEINDYWESLSQDQQAEFFNHYKKINRTFETVWDVDDLTATLQSQIANMLAPFDDVRPEGDPHWQPPGNLRKIGHWLEFYGRIIYPEGLDETFIEGVDHNKTRNRTYDKRDYTNLLILSAAFRPIFPIWSFYIHRIKDEVNNNFKELKALKLLSKSAVYHSPAMEKLRIYLGEIGSTDQSRKKAIFSGLSSLDLSEWLMGLAVVRRLSTAILSTPVGTPSVIAWVHNYISQRISRDGGFSIGEIRDKKPERERADSEQKLSVLEQFKIKEENPAGDTVFLSYVLRQQRDLLRSLEPDCPWTLVREANESLRALNLAQLHDGQILLLKNVLNNSVPHQGITSQIKKDILSGMAVAQAILIHRGYLELAALMTAVAIPRDEGYIVTSMETRTRIPRDMFQELDRFFPHPRRTGGRNRNSRQNNPASANIDFLTEKLSEHAWRLTLPNSYVEKLTGSAGERHYTVPQNIKTILAKFTIDNCYRMKALVEAATGQALPEPPSPVDYSVLN